MPPHSGQNVRTCSSACLSVCGTLVWPICILLYCQKDYLSKDKQWQQTFLLKSGNREALTPKWKRNMPLQPNKKTNNAWLKSDFLRSFCFRSKLFGNNFVDFGLLGSCNMTKTIKTNCIKFAAPDTVETSVSNTRRKSIGQIRKFDYLSLTGGGVLWTC